MKSIPDGMTTRIVAPFLIAAVTLTQVACGASAPSSGDDTNGSAASSVATRYDGETVFRGFFLGTGPVADQLPELRAMQAAPAEMLSKDQLAAQLQDVSAHLRQEGKSVTTSDHIDRIAADIRSGATTPEELLSARRNVAIASGDRIVAHINAVDPTFLARFGADFQSGDHLRIQSALEEGGRLFLEAGAAEGALPGQVNPEMKCIAVVVVLLLLWLWAAYEPGGNHILQRMELIDTIATRFAK